MTRPDPPIRGSIDRFGRVATDLRISLTDRCNLRCTYCMPAEGLPWMPRAEQLTDAELVRLITIAVRDLGVHELRFTGGEPLLRRGLEDMIAASAALTPRPDISLTTNGVGLARRAAALAAAGVNRLNVSLDTLRPDRFAEITRRDRLADVLDGMGAAREAGLSPVKINTVLLRGVNDDEAVDLLRYRRRPRFRAAVHRADAARRPARLAARGDGDGRRDPRGAAHGVHPDPGRPRPRRGAGRALARRRRPGRGRGDRLGDPAVLRRLRPHPVDGRRPGALVPVRPHRDRPAGAVRAGSSDAEIADTWRTAMWGKLAGHGIDEPGFLQPDRPMSAIGG